MREILLLGLLAWGCGSPPTAPSSEVPPEFVIVAGMNVVGVGTAMRFAATAYPYPVSSSQPPSNLTPPPFDVTQQGNWLSSDPTVATVSSNGLVTARRPGTAEIFANYKGRSYSLPLLVAGRASG